MNQPNRIDGGLIDRETVLKFQWNERWLTGHPGDTLASALLANGLRLVGRSFKYHRPRGIFTAGSEEPNALVELRKGSAREPNTRATTVELFDGLYATSQNHRGPLEWDVMAVNDLLAPFLSAGFYYKTFMWPKAFWEKLYEPMIRASAGLGRLSGREDPDSYDHGFLHADLLVIGAGPAGLTSALAAARGGARVILADEDFRWGGRLNSESYLLGDRPGADWAMEAASELAAMPNVRLLPRTTVYGAYDHGIYGALERKTDHLPDTGGTPRQVLWRIYSKRALLAAGATERSIAFGNNDRPGIMLAGAVRSYVNRYGVTPGRKVALFTNNEDGLRTASDLSAKGIDVTVLDTREGVHVVHTSGRKALKSITLSDGRTIQADCLAVSGGWSPNVHLTCHHRSRPVWQEEISAFIPGSDLPTGMTVTGAAAGTMTLGAIVRDAHAAGTEIASDFGHRGATGSAPTADDEPFDTKPFWYVQESRARAWVDLQNDVTAKDIRQSHQEGFRSVEHLKRYTTLGMATDQGKTANILGLAIMAEISGRTIPETGTTMFRPPYTPVPIGAFAGRARGKDFRPYRLTPSHDWAAENGADFVEAGLWLRAQWYRLPGEKGWRDSVDREVRTTRSAVGVCDVSTLGKIDIQGRDAADFLNRVYSNAFLKLPVGRVRYGLMLRDDGFAYDDGTSARLSETQFVMTTTTANAVTVFRELEFARQCLWPDLDVHLISTTDAWAQFSVAGPRARILISRIVDGLDVSNEAFPFMACTACTVLGGTPARLFRISFSGELAYEIAVPARYGNSMIQALMAAGKDLGVAPYGTEALGVMRVEKGHVAGNEINGQTTAEMMGLSGMVSQKKDAIGTAMSGREEMARIDGLQLVGFRPVDRSVALTAGAHFLSRGAPEDMAHDEGWMTSVAWSPELGHSIGLGFLKQGRLRHGETIRAFSPVRGQDILVEVCSPHHIDPEGVRQRG
ncbi:sarcosine oxidase subunit alpha family protein [Ovoidimarina sediminis]|uniref:sarcosine oxidase subunit alpha family protein n=1 Tax=Ovoidimarina sediminis TaxID=3079856 RepID=UPI00290B5434|nr:sarcosine oxidase subunit alpha family protein [Rhodophyticola sp. MJ-SS7]MDU8942203.1 sarcosine oxidase subunit alpha family protein [Rhodophyticola sp. MJ-SS7]